MPARDRTQKTNEQVQQLKEDLQRLKAENSALLQEQQKLKLYLNGIPQLISYVDKDLVYRYVNPAYEKMFGLKVEKITGKKVIDIIGKDAFAEAKPFLDRVMKGHEVRYMTKFSYESGSRYMDGHLIPDKDEDGNVKGYHAILTDVSSYMETQNKLLESENKYRELVENAPIGIGLSKNGMITYANNYLLELFGFHEQQEMIGRKITNFMPAPEHEIIGDKLKQQERGDLTYPYSVTHSIVRGDGKKKTIKVHVTEIFLEGERYSQGIFEDITEIELIEKRKKRLAADALYLNEKNKLITELEKVITQLFNKHHIGYIDRSRINEIFRRFSNTGKDWKIMKAHFESLHKDFFKKLLNKFPDMTQNELRHCAYIKMNLATKEIANLLNVQDTSIQRSRVRLKKKMGLGEEDSLIRFIHNI